MEAATSTLADALLDDLDDLSDVDDEGDDDEEEEVNDDDANQEDDAAYGEGDVTNMDEEEFDNDEDGDRKLPAVVAKKRDNSNNNCDTTGKKSTSFLENTSLQNHLKAIRETEKALSTTTQQSTDINNPAAAASVTAAKKISAVSQKANDDGFYTLILQSIKQINVCEEELLQAHSRLCVAYQPKFPELEELLPNPVQYKNAVQVIRNEMDLSNVMDELSSTVVSTTAASMTHQQRLTNNQILTISVAGSTTSGRPLTDAELQKVDDVCRYMDDVLQVQTQLTLFVQRRMQALAPNVCALLGGGTAGADGEKVSTITTAASKEGVNHNWNSSGTSSAASERGDSSSAANIYSTTLAARILGLAGGLEELSKIPACNLQVLGQVKHNAASRAGFSNLSTVGGAGGGRPHQGILLECDLVRASPKHLQKKALKTVAAKLALAARCDYVNLTAGRPRTAQAGLDFYRDIQEKISKWQEPDKAPVLKALPKPDLLIRKRRGGKRIRRLKERFEETALMKQANTRAFSAQSGEYGDDAMGLTMGLLDTAEVSAGTAAAGNLRRRTEKRKMRVANTKASRKRAAHINAITAQATGSGSGGGASSGLASSMVFTPVQGMELVNPDAVKERVKQANQKWFSDNAGFVSALPKK